MNFINGVILINEIMVLSTVGSYVLLVMLIVFFVMALGGVKLYINGRSYFSTWRRIVGIIISLVGIALLMTLWVSVRSNLIIHIAYPLGFAEHTGKYEVTVDNNVDMNEFYERYEIIDYENGVYTIKVRES